MKRSLNLFLCLTVAMFAACADSVEGSSGEPVGSGDLPVGPGTGNNPTDPGNPGTPPGDVVRFLEFNEAYGDDQIPCQGTDHCSVYVNFVGERELKVRYTENGAAVAGQTVRFKIEDDPDGLGHLSAYSAPTDANGVATVTVSDMESLVGQYAVKAWVDWEGVSPLYFDVLITPKGQVPLTVVADYDGTRPVQNYAVRLYKQGADGTPNCDDIVNLYEKETAHWQSPMTSLTQSVKKQELDDLEEEGTQTYTILGYGTDGVSSSVLSWGCDDTKGVVTWGGSTTVKLDLLDRMPLYAGTYETSTYFDLVSALPPPIDTYVYIVLDFFQSPVGGLLSLACELGNEEPILGDLCTEVFSDPTNPSLDNLTGLGGFIVQVLDTIIVGVSQDSVFGDVLQGGADIGDMLRGFQINGTMVLESEPVVEGTCTGTTTPCTSASDCAEGQACDDMQGVWAEGEGYTTWSMVVVKWSLNEECNPYTDENCGKKSFSLASIQAGDDSVTGSFAARVVDSFNVHIEPHSVNLKYGALLNAILQKVVLPLVFGDGSDGGPVIDTYEELIMSLVGGKECLDPQWQNENGKDCCDQFADSVVGEGGNIAGDVLANMCDILIPTGAAYLEVTLTGLDTDTGDNLTMETPAEIPCVATDTEGDMQIDALGSVAEPCKWEMKVNLLNAETSVDAEWWGVRAN